MQYKINGWELAHVDGTKWKLKIYRILWYGFWKFEFSTMFQLLGCFSRLSRKLALKGKGAVCARTDFLVLRTLQRSNSRTLYTIQLCWVQLARSRNPAKTISPLKFRLKLKNQHFFGTQFTPQVGKNRKRAKSGKRALYGTQVVFKEYYAKHRMFLGRSQLPKSCRAWRHHFWLRTLYIWLN